MITRKKREGRGQILRRPLTRAIRDGAGLKAELRILGKIWRYAALNGFWRSEHLGSGPSSWGMGLAGPQVFACVVLSVELGGRSLDLTASSPNEQTPPVLNS